MIVPVDPEPGPGQVVRAGPWAVANHDGAYTAVSPRCRHQLADLSEGWVDGEGCLVCPWHQSAYRLDDGRMVRGPQGFLVLRRHLPLYDRAVQAYAWFLPLRRRLVRRRNDGKLEVS